MVEHWMKNTRIFNEIKFSTLKHSKKKDRHINNFLINELNNINSAWGKTCYKL